MYAQDYGDGVQAAILAVSIARYTKYKTTHDFGINSGNEIMYQK